MNLICIYVHIIYLLAGWLAVCDKFLHVNPYNIQFIRSWFFFLSLARVLSLSLYFLASFHIEHFMCACTFTCACSRVVWVLRMRENKSAHIKWFGYIARIATHRSKWKWNSQKNFTATALNHCQWVSPSKKKERWVHNWTRTHSHTLTILVLINETK